MTLSFKADTLLKLDLLFHGSLVLGNLAGFWPSIMDRNGGKELNLAFINVRRTRRFFLVIRRSSQISPRDRPPARSAKMCRSFFVTGGISSIPSGINPYLGLGMLISLWRVLSWSAYSCASGHSWEQNGFLEHSWQSKRHLPWWKVPLCVQAGTPAICIFRRSFPLRMEFKESGFSNKLNISK